MTSQRTFSKLTLYSSTWCPDCREAKRFLDEFEVDYEVIEIDQDEEAAKRLEAHTGKRGIPYLVLDDESWVRAYIPRRGFDRKGMARVLGLN
jgi:glutaredoxin